MKAIEILNAKANGERLTAGEVLILVDIDKREEYSRATNSAFCTTVLKTKDGRYIVTGSNVIANQVELLKECIAEAKEIEVGVAQYEAENGNYYILEVNDGRNY